MNSASYFDSTASQTGAPRRAPGAMTSTKTNWESIVDERIKLAKQCHEPDRQDAIKDMIASPTYDDVHTGGSSDVGDAKLELRSLHKETVGAGRKAFEKFLGVVEGLKTERYDEEGWKKTIEGAAVNAENKTIAAMDKMAEGAREIIREVDGGEAERVDHARYFTFCVNGYVRFVQKVGDLLELIYASRSGGPQRIWTALETARRTVDEAEVAALKWVLWQNTATPPHDTASLVRA